MPRHWCHICNSFVHVDNTTMKCVTCGEDFVEVVQDEAPPEMPPVPPNEGPAPGFHQAQLDPNNPLGQIFGMFSQMLGNPAGNDPARNRAGGAQQAQGMPPFVLFPPLHQPAYVNNVQQGVPMGANGGQGGPQFQQAQFFPFPNVINLTAQSGSLQDLLQGLFGPQQMGDYVSDAGMASLLDRLFRQHQSSQVPAGKNVIDNLPTIKFTKETATGECAICKCDWEDGETALDLPCHHLFHKDCIKKWFETSNLCPMCRYEMPTDDPEYEAKRKEREAEKQNGQRASTPNGTPSSSSSSGNATSSTTTSSSSTSQAGSNRPNTNPSVLTESQEALLEEAIYTSSGSESPYMDLDEDYSSEDESQSGRVFLQLRTRDTSSPPQESFDHNFDVD